MDAAALNSTQKTGSDYGRIRAFGSMWFIAGVLLAGLVFDHLGIEWFATVLILSAIARVIGAHLLPRFKADYVPVNRAVSPASGILVLVHPGILLVILGSALINASHGFNNIFSIMHWTKVGFGTTTASVLWTVAVLAEIALMWRFKSIAKNFSARKCLLLAGLVSAARWYIAGTDPSLAHLLFLQALHSITFGLTFLATVNFIGKRVNENYAAQAQSVYAMLTTLFLGLSGWMSGWLYTQYAAHAYWAMSALALAGATAIALSFRSDLDESSVS
jgi:PPP family 3-phenylpropionic acid transporter